MRERRSAIEHLKVKQKSSHSHFHLSYSGSQTLEPISETIGARQGITQEGTPTHHSTYSYTIHSPFTSTGNWETPTHLNIFCTVGGNKRTQEKSQDDTILKTTHT